MEVTVGYVGPMTGEYTPSGIAFLRSQNIEPYHVNLEGLIYINEAFHKKLRKSALKPGDVVVVRTGAPGTAAVIPESLPIANCSDLVIIRPGEYLDPRFLAYYINAVAHHQVSANLVGAVQQHFNVGAAKNLKMLLPPIKEQQAISYILGCLDDKIELNRRMNRTLEEMAAAIFKSWFVDFDPVMAKSEGRQPFGMNEEVAKFFPSDWMTIEDQSIPSGWKLLSVSSALEINPPRKLQKGAISPYLDMASMPVIGHAPTQWIYREVGSGMCFKNGDTLLARITPCLENGKTAFVDFLKDDEIGWGSTEYIVLRSKPPLPLVFSYLLARLEDFRNHAIQSMTGSSGRQRVSNDCFKDYKIAIPTEEIAMAFEHVVKPLFDKSKVNMQEIRTLIDIRDSLLPRLLSGEIRLKQAETIIY